MVSNIAEESMKAMNQEKPGKTLAELLEEVGEERAEKIRKQEMRGF